MNLKTIRYFCEVAEAGTIARAAEKLYIAAPAISMQISQLEESLGGLLFDRSVKPMALTPLGRFFLPKARELLAHERRVEQQARDVARGAHGWLGIGFVRSLLYSVLPASIRKFRAEHPDVRLDLVETLSERQPALLRDGQVQLGLSRHTEALAPPADLHYTLLFDEPFVLAIPAGNPLSRRRRISVSELEGVPLISYPKDNYSEFSQSVFGSLSAMGIRPVVQYEAIEIHTAMGLVAAGLGVALVGASVGAKPLSDVIFTPITDFDARSRIVAITRAGEDSPLIAPMLAAIGNWSH